MSLSEDRRRAHGVQEPAEATTAYLAALVITERLERLDGGRAEWQYDLGISHRESATLLWQTATLQGPRRHIDASRAIIERLSASDESRTDWQMDLSVSHLN